MIPAVAYTKAQRLRHVFKAKVRALFKRLDVVLAPATSIVAPPIGQGTMTLEGEKMLLQPNIGLFT